MPKTMTPRRAVVPATKDVPRLDIGRATILKGSTVFIAAAPWPTGRPGIDPEFSGILCGVDHKDGVPFTVDVWEGGTMRAVYVERVVRWIEPEESEPEDDQ